MWESNKYEKKSNTTSDRVVNNNIVATDERHVGYYKAEFKLLSSFCSCIIKAQNFKVFYLAGKLTETIFWDTMYYLSIITKMVFP